MSLTKATYSMISGAYVNVFDYMTQAQIADVQNRVGSVDVTAALQAAIDTCVIGTIAQTVYFPPGVYFTGPLNINGVINNTFGEYSLTLTGYGATLKGKSTNSVIIQTITSVTQWANGLRIYGLQFDMANMPNSSTSVGLRISNSYNCTFTDLVFLNEAGNTCGIGVYDRAYSSSFNNCVFRRLRLTGTNLTDRITTLSFYSCNFAQAILDQCQIIKFYSCVVQGTLDKFVLSNSANVSMLNGDYEGNSVYLQMSSPGVNGLAGITSVGNDITTPSTYLQGYSSGSRYEDRYQNKVNASIYGNPSTSYSGAGPYQIFDFRGDPLNGTQTASIALIVVSGDNGNNGFSDIILLAFNAITIVKSTDIYGTPPTRTYSTGGLPYLYVQLSVTTAYNIRTMVMNNPGI